MIRCGSLLEIERKQGTVTLDAAINFLHSKLQAGFLVGRNGAAEQHFVGIDLCGRLLDVSDVALDELGPARPAIAFPTAELRFQATRLGQFQKCAGTRRPSLLSGIS